LFNRTFFKDFLKVQSVAIILDNPFRELEYKALAAVRLLDDCAVFGRVYLVEMYSKEIIIKLNVDCVVINFAREANEDFLQYLCLRGIKIVLLETEGASYSAREYRSVCKYMRYLDAILFWSENAKKNFENGCLSLKQPIVNDVVGFIGNDLVTPKYASFREKYSYTTSPKKKYILVNTSTVIVNPRYLSKESEINNFFNSRVYTPLEKGAYLRDAERVFSNTIDLVFEIASTFPGEKIILRPHPFESSDYYKKIFSSLSNVTISHSGPSFIAIANAKLLISFYSSTAVEAAQMGVASIVPSWISAPSRSQKHAKACSLLIESMPELVEFIRSYPKIESKDFKRTDDLDTDCLHSLYDSVGYIDGNSSNRFSAFMASFVIDNKPKKISIKLGIKKRVKYLFFSTFSVNSIRKALGFKKKYTVKKGKELSIEMIQSVIDALYGADLIKGKYKVSSRHKGVYIVE